MWLHLFQWQKHRSRLCCSSTGRRQCCRHHLRCQALHWQTLQEGGVGCWGGQVCLPGELRSLLLLVMARIKIRKQNTFAAATFAFLWLSWVNFCLYLAFCLVTELGQKTFAWQMFFASLAVDSNYHINKRETEFCGFTV